MLRPITTQGWHSTGHMHHTLLCRQKSKREKLMFDIISIKEKASQNLYKLELGFDGSCTAADRL